MATAMRNVKITLSYDGTDFSGWQTQAGYRTVQETVERAIAKLTGVDRVWLNSSSRTDAGVHAAGQVANFYTDNRLPNLVLARAINANLPEDVVVKVAEDVPAHFDANYHAVAKLYRYVIHDGAVAEPLMRRYSYQSRRPLDAQKMSRAAQPLLGRHDFHSFETDWPNRATSVRTISHIAVNRFGEYLWIDVAADGFLYNMVRAIAGTLMNVGRGYWPAEKIPEILQSQDRKQAGPTAPAQGLFLMRVTHTVAGEVPGSGQQSSS